MEVSWPFAQKLLSIPDHLRVSLLNAQKLGRATASQISGLTGRARAVESAYLNQLRTMHLLKKERQGRIVYFVPEPISNDVLAMANQLPIELQRDLVQDMEEAFRNRVECLLHAIKT